jgi:hypothetical protein
VGYAPFTVPRKKAAREMALTHPTEPLFLMKAARETSSSIYGAFIFAEAADGAGRS